MEKEMIMIVRKYSRFKFIFLKIPSMYLSYSPIVMSFLSNYTSKYLNGSVREKGRALLGIPNGPSEAEPSDSPNIELTISTQEFSKLILSSGSKSCPSSKVSSMLFLSSSTQSK